MGTTSEVFSAVILLIITLLFGVFVGSELTKKEQTTYSMVVKAVEECEATLPRNQQCEVVITARVKENE